LTLASPIAGEGETKWLGQKNQRPDFCLYYPATSNYNVILEFFQNLKSTHFSTFYFFPPKKKEKKMSRVLGKRKYPLLLSTGGSRAVAAKRQKRAVVAIASVPRSMPKVRSYSLSASKNETLTFRYIDAKVYTPDSTASSNEYRANSMFDPDSTGTGHQPYGFDQVAARYARYTVMKSKITINFMATGQTEIFRNPTIAVLSLDRASISATADWNRPEAGACAFRMVSSDSGNKPAVAGRLTLNFDPRKFFGKKTWDDDTMGALVGANPSLAALFHVTFFSPGGLACGNMQCQTIIDYTVKFYSPIELAQS